MNLRSRQYSVLSEAMISSWQREGGAQWAWMEELVDDIEGRLATKVYKVSSKKLGKYEKKATLSGEMKGVGPFSVTIENVKNPKSKSGGYKTKVNVTMTVDGKNEVNEKLFNSTAASWTMAKWVIRQLGEWR